jgi:hypothetical protein
MLDCTQIEYSLGRSSPDAIGLAASDKSGTATISKGLRVAARFFFDIGVEDLIADLNAAQMPIELFRYKLISCCLNTIGLMGRCACAQHFQRHAGHLPAAPSSQLEVLVVVCGSDG